MNCSWKQWSECYALNVVKLTMRSNLWNLMKLNELGLYTDVSIFIYYFMQGYSKRPLFFLHYQGPKIARDMILQQQYVPCIIIIILQVYSGEQYKIVVPASQPLSFLFFFIAVESSKHFSIKHKFLICYPISCRGTYIYGDSSY